MKLAHPGRVGWGILSTGHIASVFARDLALMPEEADLVAVGSRSLAKAETFARDHGVAHAWGSYAELAADPDVDVVYIASTHTDHFASAKLCLGAGKSVLVEKPITVDPDEAAELFALAAERGLFCMEAMWMRTSPLIRRAAQAVRDAEIGQLRHVAANFGFVLDGPADHRLFDPAQAGGAIWDAGVYPVHAVNLFLGEPAAVLGSGSHAASGVDSHAAALLTYPATADRPAATATVVCSIEAKFPTSLEVYGTRGKIVINHFFIRPAEMCIYRGNDEETEPEVLTTQWPGGGYTLQAAEVMRCLRAGEGESPMVPWADSLAVTRTLAAWQASVGPAETKGKPQDA